MFQKVTHGSAVIHRVLKFLFGIWWALSNKITINNNNNNNNDDDLEVAHSQSGSSSTQFLTELEFGNVGFCGDGKNGVPGEKPLGAKERTNNKLNPHMASTPGFESGPHWWEASALSIAPSLAPHITVAPYSLLYYLVLFKFSYRGDCGTPEHRDFFELITDNSYASL